MSARKPSGRRHARFAMTVLVVAGAVSLWSRASAARAQAGATGTEDETAPATPAQPEGETTEATPPSPPATDIFLIDVVASSMPWRVVDVRPVTDRDAYDNQPFFEGDGKSLLYTSALDDQTEIHRYSVAGTGAERLTETPESEYSPTPIPGWAGFSAVRVEADGTQRLWRFCGSGGCAPELLFEDIQPVGYHAWIDAETVAMFVLGEPHELVIADLTTQASKTVATDIGRALHRVPGKNVLAYVDKSDGDFWTIAFLDLATGDRTKILQTPPESEDFVWWSDRVLLIGHGSKLFAFDLEASDGWEEVADLAGHGIGGITRLAPAPGGDRLALVAERPR